MAKERIGVGENKFATLGCPGQNLVLRDGRAGAKEKEDAAHNRGDSHNCEGFVK